LKAWKAAKTCTGNEVMVHLIITSQDWTGNKIQAETDYIAVNVSSILCLGYHESYAYGVQYAATSSRDLAPSPAPAVWSNELTAADGLI
jgi:hypothetical protein